MASRKANHLYILHRWRYRQAMYQASRLFGISDIHTYRQTNRQTHTDRPTDRHTQTDQQTHTQTDSVPTCNISPPLRSGPWSWAFWTEAPGCCWWVTWSGAAGCCFPRPSSDLSGTNPVQWSSEFQQLFQYTNIVAAFRGMHVSPAKHSYVWLPRKCDYQENVTTGQTDGQTPDKVIPMCRYASQATQKETSAKMETPILNLTEVTELTIWTNVHFGYWTLISDH